MRNSDPVVRAVAAFVAAALPSSQQEFTRERAGIIENAWFFSLGFEAPFTKPRVAVPSIRSSCPCCGAPAGARFSVSAQVRLAAAWALHRAFAHLCSVPQAPFRHAPMPEYRALCENCPPNTEHADSLRNRFVRPGQQHIDDRGIERFSRCPPRIKAFL